MNLVPITTMELCVKKNVDVKMMPNAVIYLENVNVYLDTLVPCVTSFVQKVDMESSANLSAVVRMEELVTLQLVHVHVLLVGRVMYVETAALLGNMALVAVNNVTATMVLNATMKMVLVSVPQVTLGKIALKNVLLESMVQTVQVNANVKMEALVIFLQANVFVRMVGKEAIVKREVVQMINLGLIAQNVFV